MALNTLKCNRLMPLPFKGLSGSCVVGGSAAVYVYHLHRVVGAVCALHHLLRPRDQEQDV